MFSFDEDGFILEFHQVSWLIWLNLLVMFIFLLLIYYVANRGAEADEIMSINSRSSEKFQMQKLEKNVNNNCESNIRRFLLQDSKINEDQTTIGGVATTSTRSRRRKNQREAEVIKEMAEFSTHEEMTTLSYYSWNPCNWLELGRRVFLRCLGLESASIDSSSTERRNEPNGDNPGKTGRPRRPPMNEGGGQT